MNDDHVSRFPLRVNTRTISLSIAFLLILSVMFQGMTFAQDADGTPADQPRPADIIQDTPTDVPPTDVPVPTDVPPTDIPAPTDVPEPTATTRPVNSDTISADNVPAGIVLQQGETQQFDLTYFVTTPRLGTTLTAELQSADGWLVQLSANGAQSEAGTTVSLTDANSVEAGSSFPLSLLVTAPSVVIAGQTVTVWFSSTSQDLDGLVVQGIAANTPLVSISATPPPPTPTVEPTQTPTVEPIAIATPGASTPSPTIEPGTPLPVTSCSENGPASLPLVQSSRVGFGSSTFNGTSYPPLTDTITITVSIPENTSCLVPHWGIIVSASDMANKDGSVVPTNAITYQGVTGLAAPGLSETGVQPSTPLGAPLAIVNGSDKTLDPTHPSTTFGVLVNLSPPTNTPPGDYSGTIVVDSISAP